MTERDSPTLQQFRRKNDDALAMRSDAREALRALQQRTTRSSCTVNFDTLLEHDIGDALNVLSTAEMLRDAPDIIRAYLQDGGRVPYLKCMVQSTTQRLSSPTSTQPL